MTELYHYNHNHDPRSGRFTFSYGSARSSIRKANRIDAQSNEYYNKFVKHRRKADRIGNKIIAAQSKNPNSRKSQRLEKKMV